MKAVLYTLAFGALAIGSAASSQAADSTAAVVKTITALETTWTNAESANKPELIEPLFADGGIYTDSSGQVVDRAGLLAEERATHYASSTVDDMKVTVFGTTAIASYALHITGTDKDGPFDRNLQSTDTWVRMPHGKWQCVASHSSRLAKK